MRNVVYRLSIDVRTKRGLPSTYSHLSGVSGRRTIGVPSHRESIDSGHISSTMHRRNSLQELSAEALAELELAWSSGSVAD
jgi:hypothetical protein